MTEIGPRTQLFALLGDPIEHSLSPELHNAAFAALSVDAVYVALRTHADRVEPLMRGLAEAGGGGNVTVPHKRAAARALDRPAEAVRATAACNTFWWEEGRGLCGENTDVQGFTAAAEELLGADLSGARVLLLGAGGAARAVAYACVAGKAQRVDILNRTRRRAEALTAELDAEGTMISVLDGPEAAGTADYDLAVNATTLGLRADDPLPVQPDTLRAGAALDLVYGEELTPWVRAARAAGIRAADGMGMLVEQAAAALRIWLQRDPPRRVLYQTVGRWNGER